MRSRALFILIASAACTTSGGPPAMDGEFFECAARFGVAPNAPRPDTRTLYQLPFDEAIPRRLAQGVGGGEEIGVPDLGGMNVGASSRAAGQVRGRSHRGRYRYSFDFAMPVGSAVLAAAPGVVDCVMIDSLAVLHADGNRALYGHLSEIRVEPGQSVATKQMLGRSGAAGQNVPHLHFGVLRRAPGGSFQSIPIRFDDGTPEGYVPVTGQYYGSGVRR